MAKRITTIIVEPHLLVREALESLIKNYHYRVVCSVGSTAEIIKTPGMVREGPQLAILGAGSTDDALGEAVRIRNFWPNSKIVLLIEHVSAADFQSLLMSELDGCVPLFASPETLIRTLDLVTIEGARVVVTASATNPAIRRSPKHASGQPEVGCVEHKPEAISLVALPPARPAVNGCGDADLNAQQGDTLEAPRLQDHPRLSEREAQILEGLVQGHANKVIARSCDITEATVKVHMKSILRKIQVANRTQAAVWALEHGHSVHQAKDAF
jgi:two-component system nitrate/nitrite response regulator NarL